MYKLLQLKQCLLGEPLRLIERLGHSAEAYDAAKECLEQKYVGEKRLIAIHLNELENFRPIKNGQTKGLEKFADLLNVTIVNLKEAGRHNDLVSVSFHSRLQQKLRESLLIKYRCWLQENNFNEFVEALCDFVLRETEFRSIAKETLNGFGNQQKYSHRTFVTSSKNTTFTPVSRQCEVCGGSHPIWKCQDFLNESISGRWDIAKQKRLYFRCLSSNHLGRSCVKGRRCGVGGCNLQHNRLLHSDRPKVENDVRQQNAPVEESEVNKTHNNTTLLSEVASFIALRTVPVVLKNAHKRLKVNALLDDASTRSYLNADVAGELEIQRTLTQVSVGVLNGQVEKFETKPVQVRLESVNGKVSMNINALTTNRVTGSLQVVDWKKTSASLAAYRKDSISSSS